MDEARGRAAPGDGGALRGRGPGEGLEADREGGLRRGPVGHAVPRAMGARLEARPRQGTVDARGGRRRTKGRRAVATQARQRPRLQLGGGRQAPAGAPHEASEGTVAKPLEPRPRQEPLDRGGGLPPRLPPGGPRKPLERNRTGLPGPLGERHQEPLELQATTDLGRPELHAPRARRPSPGTGTGTTSRPSTSTSTSTAATAMGGG
mmetsp:Transcript_14154/g.46205  ORF Transcript_14154/g.46205 Transcript_14154/m.46205 type:complete len:206 (+) Transcript_14154:445-1062(+)